MSGLIDFLIARAKEKSTWAGLIIVVLNAVGIQVGETQVENLALALSGLVAAVFAALPERKPE